MASCACLATVQSTWLLGRGEKEDFSLLGPRGAARWGQVMPRSEAWAWHLVVLVCSRAAPGDAKDVGLPGDTSRYCLHLLHIAQTSSKRSRC